MLARLLVGVSGIGLLLAGFAVQQSTALPGVSAAVSADPDGACAGCHREIYEKYQRTPKARASGPAAEGLTPAMMAADFRHQASGVDYRVSLHEGQAVMSYARAGTPELLGEEKLEYFVGSGKRGRTYLYQVDGRWFEAPINFYRGKDGWDMAPGFGAVTRMPNDLMVEASCLRCHTTGVKAALPDARNHYAGAPFERGGIGCAACHGDASAHLASGGKAEILNPAKMAPAARDSVCLQCHLEGEAAVFRAGRSATSYQVGDDLAKSAVYFVRKSAEGGQERAVSQWEALLRSACKRASGDRLTCTNCHDPHEVPAEAERVQYFRAKCLQCHAGLAVGHHAEQPSCSSCHMPRRSPKDVAHEQSTDHDIEARPVMAQAKASGPVQLAPVGKVQAGDRELGLAYASFAKKGDQAAGEKALTLLRRVAAEGDVEVQVELGFLEQMSGDLPAAAKAYAAALEGNAYEPSALGNLAVIDARAGRVEAAVGLLKRVVSADPTQTAAGLNLAFIECRTGDAAGAAETVRELRRFAPDDAALRRFAERGEYGGQRCALGGGKARGER